MSKMSKKRELGFDGVFAVAITDIDKARVAMISAKIIPSDIVVAGEYLDSPFLNVQWLAAELGQKCLILQIRDKDSIRVDIDWIMNYWWFDHCHVRDFLTGLLRNIPTEKLSIDVLMAYWIKYPDFGDLAAELARKIPVDDLHPYVLAGYQISTVPLIWELTAELARKIPVDRLKRSLEVEYPYTKKNSRLLKLLAELARKVKDAEVSSGGLAGAAGITGTVQE